MSTISHEIPSFRAVSAAAALSSESLPGARTVNALTLAFSWRRAQQTSVESMPPLNSAPSGTSEISRSLTASSINCSVCSTASSKTTGADSPVSGNDQYCLRSMRPSHHSAIRSEEHTSELQSLRHLVCRLLLEKKK